LILVFLIDVGFEEGFMVFQKCFNVKID